jgi:hypothetical protein
MKRLVFVFLAMTFLSLSGAFADAVDDAAYNVCCQTANASCQASCAGSVRAFSCSRVYPRGCTSSCSCF